MAKAKVSRVVLRAKVHGFTQEFDVDHAERILELPGCAWELPEDSDYELNEDGTLIRRNKKAGDGAQKA